MDEPPRWTDNTLDIRKMADRQYMPDFKVIASLDNALSARRASRYSDFRLRTSGTLLIIKATHGHNTENL